MLNGLVITGAYGRTYRSAELALADWNAGKDFRVKGMQTYCSIRDSQYFIRDLVVVHISLTNGDLIPAPLKRMTPSKGIPNG